MSDHKGDCVGPCSLNCPAGTNCQGYAKAIALGNEYEAVKIIRKNCLCRLPSAGSAPIRAKRLAGGSLWKSRFQSRF
jgi:hypothetical protein